MMCSMWFVRQGDSYILVIRLRGAKILLKGEEDAVVEL